MSGVLHPVGPEPARTYWIRRGVLLAVVLVLALMVVVAVSSLTKAAVTTAPPPVIPPAEGSAVASPSSTPTPSVTPSSPATGSPSPSGSASGPVATASSETAKPSAATSSAPAAKPSPSSTPVGTPDCEPSELQLRLKGAGTRSPGQKSTFTLSLTNGGQQTCLTSVTDASFKLEIHSGKDRIWSSRDCSTSFADFDKKLAVKNQVAWKLSWNGERSVKGKNCKSAAETPRPGTYWVTAQVKGGDPARLRMIIG